MKFIDQKENIEIASGNLPEDYTPEAEIDQRRFSVAKFYRYFAKAETPDHSIRICFQDGESFIFPMKQLYTDDPFVPFQYNKNGLIFMTPCTLADQMTFFVQKLLEQPAEMIGLEGFYSDKQQEISAEAQRMFTEVQQNELQIRMQTGGMEQPQYLQTLLDGGIGTYRLQDGRRAAVALWRFGVETAYLSPMMPMYQNMYGAYQPLQGSGFGYSDVSNSLGAFATWSVPYVLYAVCDENHFAEMKKVFTIFANSFVLSEQLDAIDHRNNQIALMEAIQSTNQNQAMMQQMLSQQQASWNMVEQAGRQISQDLDSFHQQTLAGMQANDAWHQQLQSSLNGSPFSGQETIDEHIQRMRHEATMGVNTYTNEEGHETEFTTMADRVFENKADPDVHVGTESYFGSTPDGWNELNRKK
ncbi:MAG: hypothetical protein IJH14_03665 [Solobacterium sp.]|nr:hypothetical protein [Solobacterium sp.]